MFDEFQVMLYQHPFDIITLSETWLQNDTNLLQYAQTPGNSICYKNRDERRGGGVGMYINDTIKYKERQDLSKIDETIEHMWIQCHRKNKNKKYLVGVFYQSCPEDKEKLIWIQKLDTILSAITTTWSKTIAITGDTHIDYNNPSTALETYKEVLDIYNLKQHVKKPTPQGVKTIDHIVSNLETEKVLITDVLPCPTVSDRSAQYALIKIPTAQFQTRYKYIRNMKNVNTKEYYTDLRTLPFSTVYSFDNPEDQLAMLNKLILDCIDRDSLLKRTKFTRPPAPWMKQLDIIELQKQRNKHRFLAHNIPSKEN